MKVRAQIAMVMNLDKCIGCHTCSVTCKNVWTSRSGMEYAWWNNVETKPGIGYPKDWENQEKWKGGWERKAGGGLRLKQGSKLGVLLKIFANPHLPEIDDYYEPFTFDYDFVQSAPEMQTSPVARPVSILTQKRMEKIEWGPNWEEILGGEFSKRSKDQNFADIEKEIYGEFENTFMITLPRICEHCLNPACVASCPSGSIYKREEDGIVLIDQDKCRGWRMCVSGCPYKKIYYNWTTGKAEKCIFCYPRIEAGQPTVCSETCVGRIRYLGVMLYDADGITQAASVENPQDLYQAQLDIFLDPDDPAVQAQARADGVPEKWLEAARRSPAYKMAIDWKIAFPLHPEYRTLPMVWYVPPLSPINARVSSGKLDEVDGLPDVRSLRIPVRYLANLLTAGKEEPVVQALERLLAMRAFFRARELEGTDNVTMLKRVGLSEAQAHEMHRYLAIADYEDRFVIPTTHREYAEDAYDLRNECGFSFGNGCSSAAEPSMFGGKMGGKRVFPIHVRGTDGREKDRVTMSARDAAPDEPLTLRALAALLTYPHAALLEALPEIAGVIDRAALLGADDRRRLAQLVADLGQTDRLLLEERYVNLFDRGRTTSLHLFEHVHGESRDRGPAMVDLLQIYEKAGLVLAPNELPDYLPAVLEYLSCRPLAETREMLGDCAHIVRKVGETLAQRGSHYAAVLAAVLTVAAEPGLDWSRAVEPPPPEPPIDEEWADTPAFAPPATEAPSPAVVRFMPRPDAAAEHSRKGAP